MTFLSDRDIKANINTGQIVIEPFDPSNVQPASCDLTLDRYFAYINPSTDPIDPKKETEYTNVITADGQPYELPAYGFVLASTRERLKFPNNMIGRLEGKSSIGRLGLTAHVTAGFFDPGFRGHATLELFNANSRPILLWPGMKICQMSFCLLSRPAEHPYGATHLDSKYLDQTERGPKPSRYHRNFEE